MIPGLGRFPESFQPPVEVPNDPRWVHAESVPDEHRQPPGALSE